jgi:membrane-associated phospholipid phosphatase
VRGLAAARLQSMATPPISRTWFHRDRHRSPMAERLLDAVSPRGLAAGAIAFGCAATADLATDQRFSSWFGSVAIAVSIFALLPAIRGFMAWCVALGLVWAPFIGVRALADTHGLDLFTTEAIAGLESKLIGRSSFSASIQKVITGAHTAIVEWALIAVYVSFFIAPVIAGIAAYTLDARVRRRFLIALGTTLGLSAAMFWLIPTAPPWMTDPLNVNRVIYERLSFDGPAQAGAAWSFEPNPYAAFPSVHVATAALTGLVLAAAFRQLAGVALGYPLAMTVAVVALGEHFLFDAIGGWALATGAWWLAGQLCRADALSDRISYQGRR